MTLKKEMLLTKQKRLSRDPDSFPTAQLAILAIFRLGDPLCLSSVFPYAYTLIKDFHVGDESNASFYAGLFISAFAFSESLTGMFWGSLSDRIGRKPVLLLGCGGTLLSMLVVGFASNIWMALLGRVVGGLLNGNMGVIQTMVGELVHKPEHEPRAYSVMPFVWCVGTIIGPCLGGLLARPSSAYPRLFPPTGLFGTYPYLLPNLVCALLLLVSILLGYLFLVETHPEHQSWSSADHFNASDDETPLLATTASTMHASANVGADSYGTFHPVEIVEDEEWLARPDGTDLSSRLPASGSQKCFSHRICMIVVALGLFTYHSMAYDHLLPIFLQDERSSVGSESFPSPFNAPRGLGLSVHQVGLVMGVNGVIALVIQAAVFPVVAGWLGVWPTFLVVTLLHPIAYFIVPYLALLPDNLIYTGIYSCLTVRNLFSILAYPTLLIMLKEATPSPSVLGKVNGLAASAGAACRTVAPPVAGYLYGIGARQGFTGLAWWGSGLVAVAGAIQCWFIGREKHKTAHVQCVAAAYMAETQPLVKKEEVHITVVGCDA